MKYEIYINNHDYNGIEDYIISIKRIFTKNKLKINVVNKISNDVDVLFVIENFIIMPKELLEFLESSKSKTTKLCLIHTEFINKSLFLNIFSYKENFFRKCICVKIISYLYKLKKYDYKKILFHFLTFMYLVFGYSLGFKFFDIKRRIYFALRDYSLSKYINLFNYHIALSNDCYRCLLENTSLKNVFCIQDYCDMNLVKKYSKKNFNNNLLYLTGHITPFRKDILKKQLRTKYNNFLNEKNLNFDNYNFTKTNTIDFNLLFTNESSINQLTRIYKKEFNIEVNKFEIYVPQRKNWPHLSPMRIMRAFRNQSIPINVGSYKKSNYDNLCINVINLNHFIDNYNQIINNYLKNIEIKIIKFNCASDDYFNLFLENLKK